MENDFEKMDEWMMKASRRAREQKVPQKELDAFHEGVMKKIVDGSRPGFGMPFAGFVFAGAFTAAVVLGAAFYFRQVTVTPDVAAPVRAEVTLVTPTDVPLPEIPVSPIIQTPPVPALVTVQPIMDMPGFSKIEDPAFKDEDILEEIEALKELGVWSEEDEEEAGIPIEAAFLELESYSGDSQPSGVMTPPSART